MKFFKSYLDNSNLTEHLIGHASGTEKYHKNMKPEDMVAEYNKLIGNITVLTNMPDLSEVNKEILKMELNSKDRKLNELFEALDVWKKKVKYI